MMGEDDCLKGLLSSVPARRIEVPAKTVLLEAGEVAKELFFVQRGCLRLFFYNDGKDISFQFFMEGDHVASFDSLYRQEPSLFSLETLEPSVIYAVKRDDFFALVETNPEVRKLFMETVIERFHNYQRLFLSRITKKPEERYAEMLKEYPQILQRIPQHYIASYLGITPVSLSRIRSRK